MELGEHRRSTHGVEITLESWNSHSSSQTAMYQLSPALTGDAYSLLNEWKLHFDFFIASNIFLSWRNIYICLTDFLTLQPSVWQQLMVLEPFLLCFPTLRYFWSLSAHSPATAAPHSKQAGSFPQGHPQPRLAASPGGGTQGAAAELQWWPEPHHVLTTWLDHAGHQPLLQHGSCAATGAATRSHFRR